MGRCGYFRRVVRGQEDLEIEIRVSDLQAAKIAYDTAVQNAKTAEEAYEQCASQAARDLADPSKTSSTASCDVGEAAKEIRQANYEAYKKLLKLRMTEAGAKAEEVEEWLASHGRDAWKKAEKLRKSKAVENAKSSAAKGIAWTLAKAAMIFLAIGGFLHYKFGPEEPWHTTPANVTDSVKIIPVEPMQIPPDQFNIMFGGLAVPSAPTPIPDAPVALAAAALPPPVAAVAAAPAEVELTSEQGVTHEVQTTVGQVYLQSPRQVQQRIEQAAPTIQHDYNEPSKPTPHYLDQHTDQWNRKVQAENERRWQEQHQHVNIDVTNGDGSARIKVKM
jgi:hypothetical protein